MRTNKGYSKYSNKKSMVDGILFDSLKEAEHYLDLKLLQKAGEIERLELQKQFELIPAQYETVNGKRRCIERACTYKADFYYYDKVKSCFVCEDVKGMRTEVYKIKKKLMLYVHNIKVIEI